MLKKKLLIVVWFAFICSSNGIDFWAISGKIKEVVGNENRIIPLKIHIILYYIQLTNYIQISKKCSNNIESVHQCNAFFFIIRAFFFIIYSSEFYHKLNFIETIYCSVIMDQGNKLLGTKITQITTYIYNNNYRIC